MPRLERKVDRALSRIAWRLLALCRPRSPCPIDPQSIKRILFVRTDRIGDAIVSTPALQALRAHFPDAEIDVVLGRKNAAVAPLLPFVDRIFVAVDPAGTMRVIRQIRARRYDVAINPFRSASMTAAMFTALSGARVTIGCATEVAETFDIAVPLPDGPMHFAKRHMTPLAPLGIAMPPDADIRMSIHLPEAARETARAALVPYAGNTVPLAMVNISCSSPSKFWGVENFARLASEMRTGGLNVVLIAAPGDEPILRDVAQASGAPALPPVASLTAFTGIVSFAELVVTPDTSVAHIAAALGKPTVALEPNALNIIEWHPWGVPHRALSFGSGIADIPYADVAAAVRSLVSEVLR